MNGVVFATQIALLARHTLVLNVVGFGVTPPIKADAPPRGGPAPASQDLDLTIVATASTIGAAIARPPHQSAPRPNPDTDGTAKRSEASDNPPEGRLPVGLALADPSACVWEPTDSVGGAATRIRARLRERRAQRQ